MQTQTINSLRHCHSLTQSRTLFSLLAAMSVEKSAHLSTLCLGGGVKHLSSKMERWRFGAVTAAAGLAIGVAGTALAAWTVRRLMTSEGVQAMRRRKTGNDTRGMKLYHSFPFRSSRCAWLLAEMGKTEDVEVVSVSLHGPEASDLLTYRSVHPHGTLPALVLRDGTVLLESSAICLYLAENMTCPDGSTLLPDKQHQAHYYK